MGKRKRNSTTTDSILKIYSDDLLLETRRSIQKSHRQHRMYVNRNKKNKTANADAHQNPIEQKQTIVKEIISRTEPYHMQRNERRMHSNSDSDHSINGEIDSHNEIMEDSEITRKMFQPLNLGGPVRACKKCKAVVWFEERNRKYKRLNDPGFSICCLDGKVKLPLVQQPPYYLQNLVDFKGGAVSAKFRDNIRRYNSMFALTSMGGKIDKRVNNGKGPYVFKLHGQNYHKIGSLLPNVGHNSDSQLQSIQPRPRFAQLYIYDTEHEAWANNLFKKHIISFLNKNEEPKRVPDGINLYENPILLRANGHSQEHSDPSVIALSYHLEDEHNQIYNDEHTMINNFQRHRKRTMFTEWMHTNYLHQDARNLTYMEFPTKWLWVKSQRIWKRRKTIKPVGRIYYSHPTSGERFYLRMLLEVIRGPISYEDLKTVDGIQRDTFQAACQARGLIEYKKYSNEFAEDDH